MSSLGQRRFVHPLNKKIGRRTGKAVLAGKHVRRKDDGMENFDDYFSDSDMDITREKFRLDGINEESNINFSQNSKENQSSLSNNVTDRLGSTSRGSESEKYNQSYVSRSVPSLIYSDMSGQASLSQAKNMSSFSRKKFVHPLNKKIGRRTGKDVIANKQITVDEDGFENFDDYLSESDVSTISSRLSVSMRATRKSSHSEYTVSSLAASSIQTQEDSTKGDTNNEHTEMTDSDRDNDSQETGTEDEVSSQETGTEDEVNSQATDTADEVTSQETGTEDDVNEEDGSLDDNHPTVDTDHPDTIDIELSQESVDDNDENPINDVDDNDNSVEDEDGDDVDDIKDNDENVDDIKDNDENEVDDETAQSKIVIQKSSSDQSVDCDDDDDIVYDIVNDDGVGNDDDDNDDNNLSEVINVQSHTVVASSRKSTKKEANEEIKQNQESVNDEKVSENESVHNDDEYTEIVNHESENNTQNQKSESDAHSSEPIPGEKSQSAINKTETSSEKVCKNVTSVMKEASKGVNTDKVHGESVTGNIELMESFNEDNNKQYDRIRGYSNIDVAGNKSGSITKLERPASVVSFNRTRKRLSYSALEKSEESMIEHRERIKEANKQLTKDENISSSKQSTSLKQSDIPVNTSQPARNVKSIEPSKNMTDLPIEDDDGGDIMCLTSKSTKLHGVDKKYESEESDSDDDIAIIDDVKKSFFVNDKGKKAKSGTNKDKISSGSSENENTETNMSQKSRTSKSKTTQKNLVKNLKSGNKKVDNDKDMDESKKSKKAKLDKKKRKLEVELTEEKLDIEKNDHEANPDHMEDVNLADDDNLLEDIDVDNYNENRGELNSKNETNVEDDRTNSKRKSSRKARSLNEKQSVKKLKKRANKSKETSTNKKSHSINNRNNSVGTVSELECSTDDFKDIKVSKSTNKSRNVKRASSSDEASPSVNKKSRKSVTSNSRRKNTKTKSSSSSEEDHVHANSKLATPAADSQVPGGNFGSGVSFRVSRRSEVVDDIGSGYAGSVTQRFELESAPPAESLTPCISRPGMSRKKKGRRVTLCPEENVEHEFEKDTSSSDNVENVPRRFRHSYGSAGDSPLPSPSSTPVHIHEITKTDTPHPGIVCDEMIVDKLIKPPQPVEGLRRSSRTRLRPVAWYKNERVVFDYSKPSGPAIIGVKPSKEMIYKMAEEKKRKRRQLSYQIKKASTISNSDKSRRKLSIHFDLPDDVDIDETPPHEITVYNPFSEIEDGIDCVAKKDSSQPVGPGNKSPKKDDPYLITRLLSHPCISAGKLSIKPNAHKPEHRVTADYVLFNIEYGKILVKIHKTSTLLETGDIFMVPTGNTYSIQNLRADDARLHYSVHRHFEPDHPSEGISLHENIIEGT
ncbi:hypothetical protein ACF0H5_005421 [Mactra antiquata]